MHYPSTVAISDAEGEAIADYVNLNSMRRLHDSDKAHDDDGDDEDGDDEEGQDDGREGSGPR